MAQNSYLCIIKLHSMNDLQTNTPLIPRIKILVDPARKSEHPFNSSCYVADGLRPYIDEINYRETFIVLCLDTMLNPIGFYEISKGGTAATVVDVFMIAQIAFLLSSKHIIIAHNHPSGNINPSNKDFEVTENIKKALKTLDIKLIDHLIITNESHYSFADNGNI